MLKLMMFYINLYVYLNKMVILYTFIWKVVVRQSMYSYFDNLETNWVGVWIKCMLV